MVKFVIGFDVGTRFYLIVTNILGVLLSLIFNFYLIINYT